MVLWWIPADHVPTVEQATARLAQLEELGPTPDAFTFRELFLPPGQGPGDVTTIDGHAGSADRPPGPRSTPVAVSNGHDHSGHRPRTRSRHRWASAGDRPDADPGVLGRRGGRRHPGVVGGVAGRRGSHVGRCGCARAFVRLRCGWRRDLLRGHDLRLAARGGVVRAGQRRHAPGPCRSGHL